MKKASPNAEINAQGIPTYLLYYLLYYLLTYVKKSTLEVSR